MPSRAGTYNAAFLEEDATVRILAVGTDDYEVFPSALAHEIARGL
ncbi:hypothetical protein V8Z69_17785 [Microbacterium aurugineum]|jgi:hypothetical protein|nr:hypothetical protein OR221_2112 [Microbacterium laevaniformans OR221]